MPRAQSSRLFSVARVGHGEFDTHRSFPKFEFIDEPVAWVDQRVEEREQILPAELQQVVTLAMQLEPWGSAESALRDPNESLVEVQEAWEPHRAARASTRMLAWTRWQERAH